MRASFPIILNSVPLQADVKIREIKLLDEDGIGWKNLTANYISQKHPISLR